MSTAKTGIITTIRRTISILLLSLVISSPTWAGPIFLIGHDPDFHAIDDLGARNLMSTAIDFARDGDPAKFVYIDSKGSVPAGHRAGVGGITASGYTMGVDFDYFSAADMTAGFWSTLQTTYSAIVVASDFGGILRNAELDNLNANALTIASFINAGGGLVALSEGDPTWGLTAGGNNFGFLPVSSGPAANPQPPYSVTPYGASLGLTNADVASPSHNFFTELPAGFQVVSRDARGRIMSMAGVVGIDGGGGFVPLPEPGTLVLFGLGLAGMGLMRRRQKI